MPKMCFAIRKWLDSKSDYGRIDEGQVHFALCSSFDRPIHTESAPDERCNYTNLVQIFTYGLDGVRTLIVFYQV